MTSSPGAGHTHQTVKWINPQSPSPPPCDCARGHRTPDGRSAARCRGRAFLALSEQLMTGRAASPEGGSGRCHRAMPAHGHSCALGEDESAPEICVAMNYLLTHQNPDGSGATWMITASILVITLPGRRSTGFGSTPSAASSYELLKCCPCSRAEANLTADDW